MVIDDRVESLVRRVLGAVVKRDESGFDAALRSLTDEETRRKSLELALAICAFAILDTYEGKPAPEDIELAAQTIAEMERWSSLTPAEIGTFLAAIVDHKPLDQVLEPETAVMLTYIVTGSLLAASPKIGKDEWWFNYLDRVEAAIEATPKR